MGGGGGGTSPSSLRGGGGGGSTLKGKNKKFAPLGSKFFPLRVAPKLEV